MARREIGVLALGVREQPLSFAPRNSLAAERAGLRLRVEITASSIVLVVPKRFGGD